MSVCFHNEVEGRAEFARRLRVVFEAGSQEHGVVGGPKQNVRRVTWFAVYIELGHKRTEIRPADFEVNVWRACGIGDGLDSTKAVAAIRVSNGSSKPLKIRIHRLLSKVILVVVATEGVALSDFDVSPVNGMI